MKRQPLTRLASIAVILTAVSLYCFVRPAAAATYNNNDIINDVVFDNINTMSAAGINSFLNQFPNSCISPNHGFSAPDPTGYNPTNGFLYGGNVSAGQVVYDSARAYGLNPEVLLTTLQKEQSLVDGSAGCSTLRYTAATGYGCPDGGTTYNYSGLNLYSINGSTVTSVSGTCVNTSLKAGFSQQVIRAAWLLRFGEQRSEGNINWAIVNGSWDNSDDPQSCYGGPMTQGTFQRCPSGATTYYDGYTTIDSTSVHMDNGATAALYWYTPHFSGNMNFFNIFNSWFGSPYTSNIAYEWNLTGQDAFADSGYSTPFTSKISLTPGQKAYLRVKARNFGYQTWQQSVVYLGTSNPIDRSSVFADSSWWSPSRIAMQQTSVLPGDTATFQFSITAPSTPGTYYEYFNLVASGITWMNDPGLYYSIDVIASTRQASNAQNTGLASGQSLSVNQYLLSPDAQSTVNFQPDGNIVEYSDFRPVWASNLFTGSPQQLIMQVDGNLVEYDTTGHPIWASNTSGNAGAYLKLQTDGNLVINTAGGSKLWSSNVTNVPDHLNQVDESLPSGALFAGQSLQTPDLRYNLTLQTDGNLVEYDANGSPVWASNTWGNAGTVAVMQSDGNLVLYTATGKPIWATNTSGKSRGSTYLTLQSDGTIALYGDSGSIMTSNSVLHAGQSLRTPDRRHIVAMQTDGNLVVYANGRPTWASNTSGKGGSYAWMQPDGNLVLYTASGKSLWATNTSGRGNMTIWMQNDGNLVLYNSLGHPTWASQTSGT